MPALPLTPSQLADAERFSNAYLKWRDAQKAAGLPSNQDHFASLFGMTQGAISQYKVGKIPLNVNFLVQACKILGCAPYDISPDLAEKIEKIADASDGVNEDHAPVPLIDAKASAGRGTIVFSADDTKTLMFRRDFLSKNGAKPDDVIAFHVTGKSMVDLHIIDKSVVIANRKKKEPVNKRIYVLWIDGELFVKQLISKDGVWFARSHNKEHADDYPDIQIDIDDRIVGRVFWCGFSL